MRRILRRVSRRGDSEAMEKRRGRDSIRYRLYLRELDKKNRGASVVHRAVVEEIRKCAVKSRKKKTPSARMKAQIECAKQIPKKMQERGFVLRKSRSSVHKRKRR